MLSKHQPKPPFVIPERLLRAAKLPRQGRFVDARLGDVPVNFLSDVNITNGNSGSATLNAQGEVVGLAFDGTYESVASDWMVLAETRSIHVDIRYVLWLLEQVEQADHLLRELDVTPGTRPPAGVSP
jgi:S1-C subfamily serine protease